MARKFRVKSEFLRDIIEKYDPTEDGSSDLTEDNFGTDGEGASVE